MICLENLWRLLCKTSWRCLEDVLKTCLEDVFKTSWRSLKDVLKTFSKHLEEVLKMSWRRLENVLKTYTKTNMLVLMKASWRRLEDFFWRRMSKANIFLLIKTFWRRLLKTKTKTSSRCLHQDECFLANILKQTVKVKHSISRRSTFSPNPYLEDKTTCFPFFASWYGL